MQQSDVEKVTAAQKRYGMLERVLDKMRLPGLLLGAAAGVALVAFGLAPLLALTTQGVWMCGTLAAVAGGGVTFGYIDKFCDRFGARNLALSYMMTGHHLDRVHEEFKQTLPLKDDAKKAFIRAITEGIKEKLHIRKPLTLKKAPQANL